MSTPALLAALKCSDNIPESYKTAVPGVSPLQVGAVVGTMGVKLDGQTANLERANGRTADVIAITEACDKRQAEVMKALKHKWF